MTPKQVQDTCPQHVSGFGKGSDEMDSPTFSSVLPSRYERITLCTCMCIASDPIETFRGDTTLDRYSGIHHPCMLDWRFDGHVAEVHWTRLLPRRHSVKKTSFWTSYLCCWLCAYIRLGVGCTVHSFKPDQFTGAKWRLPLYE